MSSVGRKIRMAVIMLRNITGCRFGIILGILYVNRQALQTLWRML